MVAMALPIEAPRRSELVAGRVIEFPRREQTIPPIDPSADALKQFLDNGNDRYVKNLVSSCLPFVPENRHVEFIDAVRRRADALLEMIQSREKASMASVILDFLSQDWD